MPRASWPPDAMEGGGASAAEALRGPLAALPALPPLPATLDALLRHAESTPEGALAACARRDPALLAYILKGRDALAAPESLAAAVPLDALLHSLAPALAAQLIAAPTAFGGGAGDAHACVVWPRAIRTACLAEALAQLPGLPEGQGPRAYAMGLLLDLGASALWRLDATAYAPILHAHAHDRAATLAAERTCFGMTHSLAGRILADAWRLPGEVRRHIWLQNQPRPVPAETETGRALSLVLHWARCLAWGEEAPELAQSFSVSPAAVQSAIESAEDCAAAVLQSAPAATLEPEAFRARLSAFIAAPASPSLPEALAWAEQALMAHEGAAHVTKGVSPAPVQPQRDDALAAIARALRMPVAQITAHANALLTGTGTPDAALLRAIHEEGQQAERLLEDALAYAQPGALEPELQLLNYFLRRFFQGLEERMRWRGIRIQFEFAEGLPRVALDRAAFEQVLLALAVNAEQAMGDLGGVLTIATACGEDGSVMVSVADSGRGLDASSAVTVFEPFIKGPFSGDGPGLGLTVAQAILAAHGGHIALQPGAHGGAVCLLTLPALAAVRRPSAQASPEPEERPILRVVDVQPKSPELRRAPESTPESVPVFEPTPAREADPARVLMVDPDFELGELLHELLGRRGFEVVYLRDPAQALAEAAAAPFGQVLVDAALTTPDGRPLALVLHEVLPGARLILTLTPGAPIHEVPVGSHAPRLEKPFPIRLLLAALHPAGSVTGG